MIGNLLSQRAKNIQQSSIRAITKRVESIGGVNFSQGLCPLPLRPEVAEAARRAIDDGFNSYTSCYGLEDLRASLVARYDSYNSLSIDTSNILVTAGATGAFESICKSFLEPGDEVVMFEPFYQYHERQVLERGASPRYVRMYAPAWEFSQKELKNAFSPKTKFIVFSNPNNPTGKVFTFAELEFVGNICRDRGVFAVVDEVYEYILMDGARHVSLASIPGMFEHSITISSASKTFFVTGWRVGWLVGPREVIPAISIKSDDTYICAPTPFQYAVNYVLTIGNELFQSIGSQFQGKRDQLAAALKGAGFTPYIPTGAYYILADYSGLGFRDDNEAVHRRLLQ